MIGNMLTDDYLVNGPGTLRKAIANDPAVKLIIPMLHHKMKQECPLFATRFEEDFHAELSEPAAVLCRSDNTALLDEADEGTPC